MIRFNLKNIYKPALYIHILINVSQLADANFKIWVDFSCDCYIIDKILNVCYISTDKSSILTNGAQAIEFIPISWAGNLFIAFHESSWFLVKTEMHPSELPAASLKPNSHGAHETEFTKYFNKNKEF